MTSIYEAYFKGKLLLTVPIYFRTKEENRKDHDRRRAKFLRDIEESWLRSGIKFPQDEKTKWEIRYSTNYYYPWKYNEVIGFVEIIYFENALEGFLFLVEARRFRPVMRNKKFKLQSKIGDISYPINEKTNEEIAGDIVLFITNFIKDDSRLKRYHVDMKQLNNLLPLIDFSLIQS